MINRNILILNRIRIFVMISFLFFSLNANAQVLFQKRLDNTFLADVRFAVPNQSGVMLAGYTDGWASFVQVDNNADTLRIKTFDQSSIIFSGYPLFHSNPSKISFFAWNDQFLYLFKMNNFLIDSTVTFSYAPLKWNEETNISYAGEIGGKFVVVGATPGYVPDPFPGYLIAGAVVSLFDSTSGVLWSNYYRVGNYFLMPRAFQDTGDSYLLVGNCDIRSLLTTSNKIFAIRINKSDGSVIGQAEIYDSSTGEMTFIAANNNEYLCGHFYDLTEGEATSNTIKGTVFKINSAPTPILQWAKTIDANNFPQSGIYFVTTDNDGKTYIGGTLASNAIGNKPSHYFLAKSDGSFSSFDWGKIYSDTLYSGEVADRGAALFGKDLGSTLLTGGQFNGSGLENFINIQKNNGQSCKNSISVQPRRTDLPMTMTTVAVEVSNNVLTLAGLTEIPSDIPISLHPFGRTQTVCLETVVGVEEIENGKTVLFYPNPTSGLVNLEVNTPVGHHLDLSIINSMGHVMGSYQIHTDKIQIDLSDYSNGLYFYRIKNKDNIVMKGKFIKQ